jgi:glycosyltransferase involved in cell wall biosynthesis
LIETLRILFVHEVNYLTKPIYEMHEFPEHLAAQGHDVGFWHFPEGFSRAEVRSLGWRKSLPGRVVPGTMLTLFTPSVSGSLWGRLLTSLIASHFAKRALTEFQPDLVVSFSVPTQGWQVTKVANKMSIPLLFRALDVSHKIRRGIFSKLIFRAESLVYKNADWVSANNPAMLDYCQSMGAEPLRSSVEWPPIDLDRFRDAILDPHLKSRLAVPEDQKIVLYMGSFFYFSGLPEVLQEFSRLSANEHLVLIGGGEQDSELRELVETLGISGRVTFTGFIRFEELPNYLKLADVAINPMHPSLVANAAIPNKVIQYLASGLRVVSTRLKGLELTFGESDRLSLVDSPVEVVHRALEICRQTPEDNRRSHEVDLARFELEASIEGFRDRCLEVVRNA